MENKIKAIYILNPINTPEVYIGATNDLKERLKRHRLALNKDKHHNPVLQKRHNENKEIQIVAIPLQNDSNPFLLEKELIKEFSSNKNCLNIQYNINREPIVRKPISDETREKMRLAKLGTKQSDETKEKRAESHRGQKRSEEARKNLSLGQIGNTNFLGKKHTEETKLKLSTIAKELGRVPSKLAIENSIIANRKRREEKAKKFGIGNNVEN